MCVCVSSKFVLSSLRPYLKLCVPSAYTGHLSAHGSSLVKDAMFGVSMLAVTMYLCVKACTLCVCVVLTCFFLCVFGPLQTAYGRPG